VVRPQDQGDANDCGQQLDVRSDLCGCVLSVCVAIENTLAEWSEDLAHWDAILPRICCNARSSQPEQGEETAAGRRHSSSRTPRGGDGSWEMPLVIKTTPGGRLVAAA